MQAYTIAIAIGLAVTSNSNGSVDKLSADTFANTYSSEHSEFGRRDLCIKAMDAGLIHIGMSVSDLNKLFGTKFIFNVPPAFGALDRESINFAPKIDAPPSPVAIQAPAPPGWYFYFEFDKGGHIWTYYISNAHDK